VLIVGHVNPCPFRNMLTHVAACVLCVLQLGYVVRNCNHNPCTFADDDQESLYIKRVVHVTRSAVERLANMPPALPPPKPTAGKRTVKLHCAWMQILSKAMLPA
jgi:hypothetical protein